MNLQDQVTSLEISKRLKELGVEQESLFWWVGGKVVPSGRIDYHIENNADYAKKWLEQYSAFTVAELIFMLQERGELAIIIGKNDRDFVNDIAKKLIKSIYAEKGKI